MQGKHFGGKPTVEKIQLAFIRTDGGTQARVKLDPDAVEDYADSYRRGCVLPPVVVFFDDTDIWLADGFHRVEGARLAELVEIDAEVRQGTRKDARRFARGANAAHGLRRTNADKRKAVLMALEDDPTWSDRAIAEDCHVSQPFVGKIRAETGDNVITSRTGKDGKVYPATQPAKPAGPRIPMPPLEWGKCYRWEVLDPDHPEIRNGELLEIMPSEHQGFWRHLVYRVLPEDHPEYRDDTKGHCVDYCIRGRKLDAENWEHVTEYVLPGGSWEEVDPEGIILQEFVEEYEAMPFKEQWKLQRTQAQIHAELEWEKLQAAG